MSSRWIRSSSSRSAPPSSITVLRGVANSSRIAFSSSLMMVAHARPRAQDVEVVLDLLGDLVEFLGDLLAAERGQPGEAQFEDGARLRVGEHVGAVLLQPVARIVDQRDQRRHVLGRPAPAHQFLARRIGVLGVADDADHLVDMGDRDGEADQHVRPVARLGEQELGAPGRPPPRGRRRRRRACRGASSSPGGRRSAPPCWRRTRSAAPRSGRAG